MAEVDEDSFAFPEDDHRGAYVFTTATSGESTTTPASSARPTKRRRVSASASKQQQKKKKDDKDGPTTNGDTESGNGAGPFVSLFNGAETNEAVELRRRTFEKAWDGLLEGRIQRVLREANQNTLDEVGSFVREAEGVVGEESGIAKKIPAAFIITGPNIASQDLLFEQLSESLSDTAQARVVRLRSAGAPNLKAALKKIIRDAAARNLEGREDDDGAEVSVGEDGRKYLDYDLEGLHVFLKTKESQRVIVAFEDSEAFDSGLLTDLIALFHSWQGRIKFSLLFGIATSVELFQARLLKSTAQILYGAQFDVVQADSVLESVFKSAVAGTQAMVRLGPALLQSLLERQKDQVAGIHVFISSIKYAYMCHFYANPLSVCLAAETEVEKSVLQPEHLQAIRTLESFKDHVEVSVEEDRQFNHAQMLIENDEYLRNRIRDQQQERKEYMAKMLRCLHVLTATGLLPGSFTDIYVRTLEIGIDLTSNMLNTIFSPVFEGIKRLGADEVLSLIRSLLHAICTGSPDLDLPGWESEAKDLILVLNDVHDKIQDLMNEVRITGRPLKSKYSAQSKILRTTVVAQKVQLSHDSATLTTEDKAFTKFIDALIGSLASHILLRPLSDVFLNEVWVYDSKAPYRDVFVPRPGTIYDRALSRPHDYLNCSCCSQANGGVCPTMPTTTILHHLYMETGSLVNVADLWSAYYAWVGDESEMGLDERTALLHFYRGLSELKLMGFVKQSKKKADHVAKLKWM